MSKFLDEKILETENFSVGQDWEVPILGFFIIASKDKSKNKITDFTESELIELINLQKRVREIMENYLGIKVVYFFQNEDTEHGFHVWCFSRHTWMEEFGNKIQSVRPIMNFAKENMFTTHNLEIIKKSCEEIRKSLQIKIYE